MIDINSNEKKTIKSGSRLNIKSNDELIDLSPEEHTKAKDNIIINAKSRIFDTNISKKNNTEMHNNKISAATKSVSIKQRKSIFLNNKLQSHGIKPNSPISKIDKSTKRITKTTKKVSPAVLMKQLIKSKRIAEVVSSGDANQMVSTIGKTGIRKIVALASRLFRIIISGFRKAIGLILSLIAPYIFMAAIVIIVFIFIFCGNSNSRISYVVNNYYNQDSGFDDSVGMERWLKACDKMFDYYVNKIAKYESTLTSISLLKNNAKGYAVCSGYVQAAMCYAGLLEYSNTATGWFDLCGTQGVTGIELIKKNKKSDDVLTNSYAKKMSEVLENFNAYYPKEFKKKKMKLQPGDVVLSWNHVAIVKEITESGDALCYDWGNVRTAPFNHGSADVLVTKMFSNDVRFILRLKADSMISGSAYVGEESDDSTEDSTKTD